MEFLAGILIIGVVIWLSRVWVGRSASEQDDNDSSQVRPSPLLYGNSSNSLVFDPAISSTEDTIPDDSTSYSADTPRSGNDLGTQDCAPDSGTDNSANHCSCPSDSTSYDSGGCSVDSSPADSSSFDSSSSN